MWSGRPGRGVTAAPGRAKRRCTDGVVARLWRDCRAAPCYAHYMFVRLRQPPRGRLQLSLVEARRHGGKVRHEHIASLGSVPVPPTVADRLAFWAGLHGRLARLGNRLDPEAQGNVLGAVHARVPMVTAAEQRDLQLANAKADAQYWDGMAGTHAEQAEGEKGVAAPPRPPPKPARQKTASPRSSAARMSPAACIGR